MYTRLIQTSVKHILNVTVGNLAKPTPTQMLQFQEIVQMLNYINNHTAMHT